MKSIKHVFTDSRGVMHLIAILAVVVVGVVGVAGYYVVTANKDNKNKTAEQVTVPDQINSKSDLEQASKALDAQQSDSDLDPDQLDDDLNVLL